MKKQIAHISVLQTAKVSAVLYLVVSIPFAALMVLPALFTGQGALPLGLLLLTPVLYMALGFVLTVIAAWIYNLVAARIGGFEFTTADIAAD